jgi:hypothetical protein
MLLNMYFINRQLYAYSSPCLFSVLIYFRTQYQRYVSMIDALEDLIGPLLLNQINKYDVVILSRSHTQEYTV